MKAAGFPGLDWRSANRTGDQTDGHTGIGLGSQDPERFAQSDSGDTGLVEVKGIGGGCPPEIPGQHENPRVRGAIFFRDLSSSCHVRLPGENVEVKLFFRGKWRVLTHTHGCQREKRGQKLKRGRGIDSVHGPVLSQIRFIRQTILPDHSARGINRRARVGRESAA
jgi:hypothetical protein